MKNDNIIKCPKCGTEINVNAALYGQIENDIKKDFEKKIARKEKELQLKLQEINTEREKIDKERQSLKEIVDTEVQSKIKAEKLKLEKTLREEIQGETSDQIALLQKALEEKSEQVKELNKTRAEIEKLKREKEEIRDQIALEKEKEYSEKLKAEKLKIAKQIDEENILKIKEKDKIIEELTEQLGAAKRKAEQGSMQLQGEIQELALENMLKLLYPNDEIKEIKKGQRGADVLQIVKNEDGAECGKIYYESKRTKSFDYNWLQKLRDDNLEVKANLLVLVTETMPAEEDKFFFKDGVWICSFFEIRGLSLALRHGLIQIHSVVITQHGKEIKMEMLYNYLTSQEFKGQFGAIVEGFKSLQDNYQDEKLKMQKIWKEREKQLDKILINAVNFYGSIKGIAGASIAEIKMLESDQKTQILEHEQDKNEQEVNRGDA